MANKIATVQTDVRADGSFRQYRVHLSDQRLPHCTTSADEVQELTADYLTGFDDEVAARRHYSRPEVRSRYSPYTESVGCRIRFGLGFSELTVSLRD